MKEKRFEAIVNEVENGGVISISDLCSHFNVSVATMRRDLAELEAQGRIKRIRGGAKALRSPNEDVELPYQIRTAINVEEKQRIAQYAVQMIQPNESIILDSSSTVRELAELLIDVKIPLTVITNDIEIARLLTANPLIELIMVGGRIRIGHFGTVGVFADAFWKQVHTDKLFLGVDAIDPNSGFFNHNSEEITGKRLMIECAKNRIVLADHYKFFSNSLIQLCDIDDINLIVTSVGLSEDIVAQFSTGCRLVCV